MKSSKLMQERVRRLNSILKELGFKITEEEWEELSYSAAVSDGSELDFNVVIEQESKFLEMSFSFCFPREMQDFLRDRMDEFLQIAYEYGTYFAIVSNEEEICLSVFSKLYFAGLQYYALKETYRDFRAAVEEMEVLFDLKGIGFEGENDGHS